MIVKSNRETCVLILVADEHAANRAALTGLLQEMEHDGCVCG